MSDPVIAAGWYILQDLCILSLHVSSLSEIEVCLDTFTLFPLWFSVLWIGQSVSRAVNHWVNLSVKWSVSQSVCLSVRLSVSWLARQSVKQSVRLPVSWSVGQTVNHWANLSVEWSAGQMVSQSVCPSVCQSVSQSVNCWVSLSLGWLVGQSSVRQLSLGYSVTWLVRSVNQIVDWLHFLITFFCLTRWLHIWACLHRRMADIWTINKSNDKCSSEEYHSDPKQDAQYAYTETL